MSTPVYTSLILALLLWGCGPSEEATHGSTALPLDSTGTRAPTKELQLESKTDTVTAMREMQSTAKDSDTSDTSAVFTVQIGAFKEPKNATRAQTLARERCGQQVFSEFNPRTGLYQIRIGTFKSHEEAAEFLQRLLHEYPTDYKGSWVATVRQ